jgi:hypothetical protein
MRRITMNDRQVGFTKSLFILVGFAIAGAAVGNCGGDDSTPGTTGAGGSGGRIDGGTDASAAGRDASAAGGDASIDRADAARVDTGAPDSPRDASPPTEADIATCNAALSDGGAPCFTDCLCSVCAATAVQCLGDPGCVAITQCVLQTQCAAVTVTNCLDSETCGAVIAANLGSLAAARALVPCVATCAPRCAAVPDASFPGDSDLRDSSAPDDGAGDAAPEVDDGGTE